MEIPDKYDHADRIDSRRNNIDFMRFLLALTVVLSHSFVLSGAADSPMGSVAVDGFFILSGFLVTASYFNSKSVAEYMKKRIRRIYPAFVVAMLFCLLIVVPLAGASLPHGRLGTFFNFLFSTLRLRELTMSGALLELSSGDIVS